MDDFHALSGSCLCERNQFTVFLPASSPPALARVYYDISASSRRAQATPVVAWLRVPLTAYHSATHPHYPDESPASIKRTLHTPRGSSGTLLPPTRRQFCGYCGCHLTRWDEGAPTSAEVEDSGSEFLDITLGSLHDASLEMLERLGLFAEDEEDAAAMAEDERRQQRGMPYFDEMVEHSRLGGRLRQVRMGGSDSADGGVRVRWEVVEVGGEGDEPMHGVEGEGGNKRQKLTS